MNNYASGDSPRQVTSDPKNNQISDEEAEMAALAERYRIRATSIFDEHALAEIEKLFQKAYDTRHPYLEALSGQSLALISEIRILRDLLKINGIDPDSTTY